MRWPHRAAWPLTVPGVQGQGAVIMGHPVPPSENPGLAFWGRQRAGILMKTHEALGGKEGQAHVGVGWGGGLWGPGRSNPDPALVGSRALGGLILTDRKSTRLNSSHTS